jgi:predicted MFS family arabinose efflux permease
MNTQSPAVKSWELTAAVCATLLVQTAISFLIACVPVLAPVIATSRDSNVDLIAFYGPITYLVAFLVSFQVPKLLQALGGYGLGLLCVGVSAIGLLFLLPQAIVFAIAVPIAAGMATGAMNPASVEVLGPRTTPGNAALVLSIKQTGVPLGVMVAGALAPAMALYVGLQSAILYFVAASAILLVGLAPLARWLNGEAKAPLKGPYRPLGPAKELLTLPGMKEVALLGAVFCGMQVAFRSFFTVYLVRDLNMNLVTAGLAFSLSQVAGMIGQIGWALVADRFLDIRQTLGTIGFLIGGAAIITAGLVAGSASAWIMIVAIVFGATVAGFMPVLFGEVARRAPAGQAGALTAGLNLFLIGGSIAGPLIFGAIAYRFGYPVAFLFTGLGTCLAVAAVFLDRRRADVPAAVTGQHAAPQDPIK